MYITQATQKMSLRLYQSCLGKTAIDKFAPKYFDLIYENVEVIYRIQFITQIEPLKLKKR